MTTDQRYELTLTITLTDEDIANLIPSGNVWIDVFTYRGSVHHTCDVTKLRKIEEANDTVTSTE